MKLEDVILSEHSRKICDEIVGWVGKSQVRFGQLLGVYSDGNFQLKQRASWPISECVKKCPPLAKSHFQFFLEEMENRNRHFAVKRNLLRLFQFAPIPEEVEGLLLDRCFTFLEDIEEPVAIKSIALHLLWQLSGKYPEIKAEVCLLIEDQLPHQTAAFRAAAKIFLK